MKYTIKDSETFIRENVYNEGDAVNEAFENFKTKASLAKIMKPTFESGKDIFKQINERVDELETLIKDHNEELKKSNKYKPQNDFEQLLTEKIDRTLLSLNSLLAKTNFVDGKFTKDVFLSSVINFKALLSPIRAARIMALGYKYYMRLINHTICQSLVCIELYSDTFFTAIRDAMTGKQSEMMEVESNARQQLLNQLYNFTGDKSLDDKAMKKFKQSVDVFAKMQQNAYNSYRYSSSSYGRTNLFQESGRNVESLMRDDNAKEIQAILAQFTNYANKPTKNGEDNMLPSFAEAVRLAAESRAYKVCATIRMNMIEILKIFSIRTQDRVVNFLTDASTDNNDKEKERTDAELISAKKEVEAMRDESEKLKDELSELKEKLKKYEEKQEETPKEENDKDKEETKEEEK